MEQEKGHFVISLDFEIIWGVRDVATVQSYGDSLRGVQQAIPKMLSLFNEFGIAATFSTVGLLFFETKSAMLANLPERMPHYDDDNLSPYNDYMIREVGDDYTKDIYHFAPHLIKMIQDHPGQEIGTHTFSHYYCLEAGQTIDDFRDDLQAVVNTAQAKGIKITSIIFPRNQYSSPYLQVCKEAGIVAFRGNERHWLYHPIKAIEQSFIRRMLRWLDTYVNITGYHCYMDKQMLATFPVNIPSSRFLRPYSPRFKYLERLRMRRIKKAMTYAAKNKLTYHIWTHPHNLGKYQDENFSFLEEILQHYKKLNDQYGFTSITMSALARQLLAKDGR